MAGEKIAASRVRQHVRMTVTGDCGHVLGSYLDTIAEKYPFWCRECEDYCREGKYPWTITTELIRITERTTGTQPTEGK